LTATISLSYFLPSTHQLELDLLCDMAYSSYDDAYSMYMRRPPVGMSSRRFDEYYRCYPIIMMNGPDREHLNHGGKVFLPPSALQKISHLNVVWPLMFELINGQAGKMGHAGLLEFTAEEGRIYLPHWVCLSSTST
jgi:ubiquitin fusion degradation protein 1